MIPFSKFIIEVTELGTGIVTINAPAIAAAIYKVGKTIVLHGRKYRVIKHDPVTMKRGMKYIEIELEPVG